MSKKKQTPEHWLSTDEVLEAVISLEMVFDHLPKTKTALYYWKWVLIALHNAVQGYMVLALRGSNGVNVLKDNCAKQWAEALKNNSEVFPERKLDSFLNLYKKIKKTEFMMRSTDARPFRPRGTQTRSVKLLNHLRNDFIHFLPKGWLLEVSGLSQVMKDCVNVIDFLAFESGNVWWHDVTLEARTKELIEQIRLQL